MTPALMILFAQAALRWGVHDIVYILAVILVIGGVFYIFNQVVHLPSPFAQILNIVLGILVAIMAMYFLASLL